MQSLTLLNNQYRIIKQLGEGGFGKTYLAEDTHMPSGRHCVIKQLKPDAENSQIYQLIQERFQREAAILEDLGKGHPQIPTLYGYFREADKFYLVQELIEGQTLTQKIHISGVMSESSVKSLLSELLPVFEYVHARRIVHRDVKPDNILIRVSDNLPVLIDFGAVRETMGTVVNSQGQSTSSIVIGTPGYMPSEQAAGRPIFSSDLYALGLTAIYLLTGKIPQQLETDPQTGEILWRHYALSVSPTFGCVIDRAIMSHPRDRFSSAKEMLQAIQSGMNFPVASVPPPVTSPSPPLPPTAMSYPPAGMGIVTPLPETEVSNRPIQYATGGSKDWQKAAIIGGMIGLSTIVGLVLTRPNAAVSPPVSEENKTEEKTETPKENSVPPSTNSISTQPVSASTTTSTSPTTAAISKQDAENLINTWLQAKKQMFSPPYSFDPVYQLTTGALLTDLTKSDGPILWLKNNNARYEYGVQKIAEIKSFDAHANSATVEALITEDRTLIRDGQIDPSQTQFSTDMVRYTIQLDGGRPKLAWYD